MASPRGYEFVRVHGCIDIQAKAAVLSVLHPPGGAG